MLVVALCTLFVALVPSVYASSSRAAALFANFQTDFDKTYTSSDEDAKFQAFAASLNRTAILNQQNQQAGGHAVFGVTRFSDLTPEEFQSTYLTYKPAAKTITASARVAPMATNTLSSIDWRNINGVSYISPIRDQGSCGSCWAFATIATVESYQMLAGIYTQPLSVQQITSCDIGGTSSGCTGGYTEDAFDYVVKYGVTSEAAYPFTSGTRGQTGSCLFSSWQPPTAAQTRPGGRSGSVRRLLDVTTKTPTSKPTTKSPTPKPTTRTPTQKPTKPPTIAPTTKSPTAKPTTKSPTAKPTTKSPTMDARTLNTPPTSHPTTKSPTAKPTTKNPTPKPTTKTPTLKPTIPPTNHPTTKSPSSKPSTKAPTGKPTVLATGKPTMLATGNPTTAAPVPKPTTQTPTSQRPTSVPTTRSPVLPPSTNTPTKVPTRQGYPIIASLTSWAYVASDETSMVAALQPPPSNTNGGPLTVCLAADSFQDYTSGILKVCTGYVNHCVQLIGYGTDSGTDYWLLKNQWGTSWGEAGYLRIQRGVDLCQITSDPIYPLGVNSGSS